MSRGFFLAGKNTGTFECDINVEASPGQVCRVAFGKTLDQAVAQVNAVIKDFYIA